MAREKMYRKGKRITSLDDLLKCRYVFFATVVRPLNISIIRHWQLEMVFTTLERGMFYEAVRTDGTDEETSAHV